MLRGVALIASVVLTTAASAHDWYPPRCCSGGDCAPLEDKRVKALNGGGYVVDGKFTVLSEHVQMSQDGRFHACFPTPERMECFFAPLRGL